MLSANGFAKIHKHEVIEATDVRELIDSGLAIATSGRVVIPGVLLFLTIPDEEVSVLKMMYEKGELRVGEVKGKIKLSRIKKWIDIGMVRLEKRDGVAFLMKM